MTRFSLLLGIAKTHLLAKKKQTLIAALGVTFGISMFIIMMSFMTGLNKLLDGLVLNRTPHIQVYNKTGPTANQPAEQYFDALQRVNIINSIKPKSQLSRIHDALPMLAELKNNPKVKGVTPQATCKVFYLAGATNLNGVLNGIAVQEEMRLFNFGDYIVAGEPTALLKKQNAILLGAGIAKKLSLAVGDNIQVANPTGAIYTLHIGGIYQSGLAEVDDMQSFVSLKTAQQILGAGGNHISRIHIKLHNMARAVPFARLIEQVYNVTALDIKAANAQFDTGSDIRNLISYAVSITLLIVAGFGIYNILNMFIVEKMNDIAILKAMGFTGGDVMIVFIIQALTIGFMGAILGISLGYGVSAFIDTLPFETEALPTIKTYPINYNLAFYAIGIVFALAATFLAGFLPARKAQQIDPIEIIRSQ